MQFKNEYFWLCGMHVQLHVAQPNRLYFDEYFKKLQNNYTSKRTEKRIIKGKLDIPINENRNEKYFYKW